MGVATNAPGQQSENMEGGREANALREGGPLCAISLPPPTRLGPASAPRAGPPLVLPAPGSTIQGRAVVPQQEPGFVGVPRLADPSDRKGVRVNAGVGTRLGVPIAGPFSEPDPALLLVPPVRGTSPPPVARGSGATGVLRSSNRAARASLHVEQGAEGTGKPPGSPVMRGERRPKEVPELPFRR